MAHSSNHPDSEEYERQRHYRDTEGWADPLGLGGDNLDMQEDDDVEMDSRLLDRETRGFTESRRSDKPKMPVHKHKPPLRVSRHRKAKEEKQEIKAKSGPAILKVRLTAIKLDPEFYPPSRRRQPSTRKWFRQLRKGLKLPAVKVMEVMSKKGGAKKEFLLVGDYGIFQAHQLRAKLHKSGKLREPLSPVELETIEVELVHAPIHKTKNQRLEEKIRKFYQQFPGCPVSLAAKKLSCEPKCDFKCDLKCDPKTIRKHAGDLIEEWKKEMTEQVEDMWSQGKSNREITRVLKQKWPCARGLSQPVISRMTRKKPRPH